MVGYAQGVIDPEGFGRCCVRVNELTLFTACLRDAADVCLSLCKTTPLTSDKAGVLHT